MAYHQIPGKRKQVKPLTTPDIDCQLKYWQVF